MLNVSDPLSIFLLLEGLMSAIKLWETGVLITCCKRVENPNVKECSFVIVCPEPVSFYVELCISPAVARMGEVFSTEWLQRKLSGDIAAYFFQQVGREVMELIVAQSGKTTKVTSKGMVHIVF